jgi:hypothetical protein
VLAPSDHGTDDGMLLISTHIFGGHRAPSSVCCADEMGKKWNCCWLMALHGNHTQTHCVINGQQAKLN